MTEDFSPHWDVLPPEQWDAYQDDETRGRHFLFEISRAVQGIKVCCFQINPGGTHQKLVLGPLLDAEIIQNTPGHQPTIKDLIVGVMKDLAADGEMGPFEQWDLSIGADAGVQSRLQLLWRTREPHDRSMTLASVMLTHAIAALPPNGFLNALGLPPAPSSRQRFSQTYQSSHREAA